MISIEAGIKYYILSAVSSFFFLLGISLIYGLTGTTLYEVLYIFELYSDFIMIIIFFLFLFF